MNRFILSAVAGLVAAACCSPALAGTVPLSLEWKATWDDSLDPYVDIHVDLATLDTLYIEKSAEFIQGPGIGGVFPSISIVFQQIAPSNVTRIVILDEIIKNMTGVDWTDFHFILLDQTDVAFYAGPGFAFGTSPLNNQSFSPDNTVLSVDGFGLGPGGSNAVVPTGSIWLPGNGFPDSGNLIIQVNSAPRVPFTSFVLKELPTPEPSTVVLLALGSAAVLRRKRR